ncbi:MAG TPA: glycosyltransferase family A protein, partial [Cyclobacteriaceae bacterium]|nr:glycosyltransferase family A protein [Cyclobacteriaceae bacterium]
MSELVSIIIPTFNRGHLIGETIQSVIDQTFTNWELIVVDDGSTDDTKKRVEEFKDKR